MTSGIAIFTTSNAATASVKVYAITPQDAASNSCCGPDGRA